MTSSRFTRGDLETIFELATSLRPIALRQRMTQVLRGAILGSIFFEPSTRSRISFGTAFTRLGGAVLDTTGVQSTSVVKGESYYDTARVLGGYVDVLVIRAPVERAVEEFAHGTEIPVINAGNGAHEHPTQALLDVYTMCQELQSQGRSLDGARIAIVGEFGRTVHSLGPLLRLYHDVTVTLVSDEQLRTPRDCVEAMASGGVSVRETSKLEEGLAGADVIYMTRIQEERFESPEQAARSRGGYALTRALFERLCAPHATIMHPLPRDSRPGAMELASDLTDHPRLAIFRQTQNGVAVRMALFALVLGVEEMLSETLTPVRWHVPERLT